MFDCNREIAYSLFLELHGFEALLEEFNETCLMLRHAEITRLAILKFLGINPDLHDDVTISLSDENKQSIEALRHMYGYMDESRMYPPGYILGELAAASKSVRYYNNLRKIILAVLYT